MQATEQFEIYVSGVPRMLNPGRPVGHSFEPIPPDPVNVQTLAIKFLQGSVDGGRERCVEIE